MRNNPYDPMYVAKRDNISFQEAEQKIAEFKRKKATSLENFIKKYGETIGRQRFEDFKQKTLAVHHKRQKENGKQFSKLSTEYWERKGFDAASANLKAIEHQHRISPCHPLYWLDRGLTYEEAKLEIAKIHEKKKGNKNLCLGGPVKDSVSLEAIKNRYPELTQEQILEKQQERLATIRKTNEDSGKWTPIEQIPAFERYKREVLKATRQSIKLCEFDFSQRGRCGEQTATQLDHIYPITWGFRDGVPPEIIGSVVNLRIIDAKENISKNNNYSPFSKQELIEAYLHHENQKNSKSD